MELFGPIFQGIQRNMDLRMIRQGFINSNIANAETPNYRPIDLKFQDELGRFLDQAKEDAMSASESGHIDAFTNVQDIVGETVEQAGEMGPDGNSVDLDRQMANLAENATNFRASAKIISKKLALMRYIISETR